MTCGHCPGCSADFAWRFGPDERNRKSAQSIGNKKEKPFDILAEGLFVSSSRGERIRSSDLLNPIHQVCRSQAPNFLTIQRVTTFHIFHELQQNARSVADSAASCCKSAACWIRLRIRIHRSGAGLVLGEEVARAITGVLHLIDDRAAGGHDVADKQGCPPTGIAGGRQPDGASDAGAQRRDGVGAEAAQHVIAIGMHAAVAIWPWLAVPLTHRRCISPARCCWDCRSSCRDNRGISL